MPYLSSDPLNLVEVEYKLEPSTDTEQKEKDVLGEHPVPPINLGIP